MAMQITLKDEGSVSPNLTFERTRAIEDGLPLEDLDYLREKGLTSTEVATIIRPRTLKHRKDRGEKLSSQETERAIRMAHVLAFSERVFGNPEKSLRWLRGKDERLGDHTALSFLRTETGGKLVVSILWQIAEGMFT